jgi:hypothetical protein
MDENDIMARNNGVESNLNLQRQGGDLTIHGTQAGGTQFIIQDDGDVGIGTSNPSTARLQVEGMTGNTTAIFKGNSTSRGVAMVADWPAIYFNSYYNGGTLAMAASGYPAFIQAEQSSGGLQFFATNVANTTAGGSITMYERMRITGAGNLGIGTTGPGQRLQVGTNGDGSSAVANAWNTFSDARWKTDVRLIPDALTMLDSISGYYYRWIDKPDASLQVGLLAQEVEQVLPEVVTTSDDGYKSIDYSKMTAVLINAVKELAIRSAAQEREIAELKRQLGTQNPGN